MRMKLVRSLMLLGVLLLRTVSAFAQGTTGSLTGTISQGGTNIPGVTVTVTSPALQGSRTAITNELGAYNFAALPPGQYTVRSEMSGLGTATTQVRVTL